MLGGAAGYDSFGELLAAVNVRFSRAISPVLVVAVVALTGFLVTFFLTDIVPFYVSRGHVRMVPVMSSCAVLFGFVTLYFYFKAALTPPGYAPTVEQLRARGYSFTIRGDASTSASTTETATTTTGDNESDGAKTSQPHVRSLRLCPHCGAVRVPRSHHCRTCGRCVLKMDHHCVWIGNCVGHRNQKYFILFMLYLVAGTLTYTIFAVPMVVELHDARSPYLAVYSYSLNTFALSCALALTVSVLGMGGYNVVLTCLDLSAVEMAQRQANARYLRYRERVVREARRRGASDAVLQRLVPPLDDDDLQLLRPPRATRRSVVANLRVLFGARDHELILWSLLPLLRETAGDGYYLSPSSPSPSEPSEPISSKPVSSELESPPPPQQHETNHD